MGDEYATFCGSSCQYLRIVNPRQTRCHRGLKVDGWLASYCRKQDDLVEISVRLKADFHVRMGLCRLPAQIRELLIEHRVLLTGGPSYRLELRFGCFETGIYL